jgi:sigma-B regulation protein RsbU (phosphoserine phosphatase)
LLKFIRNISNLGIGAEMPFELRNKLKVFNRAVLAVIGITFFYFLMALALKAYISAVVTLLYSISNIISLTLIKRKKLGLAFHFLITVSFFFLAAFSVLYSGATNSFYYYLVIPVAANILFDSRKIIVTYLVISIVFLIANVYYIENYKPYYEIGKWVYYMGYPNIVFAAGLIFTIVQLFKKENLDYAEKIEEQNKVLEEKNHEITDSINYAKRIQTALIPAEDEFNAFFTESFVLLKPKDIVSGDFYWILKKDEKIFYATADCTGHGVPGGFMTMLGISFLEEIINEKNISEPAEILNQMRDRIIHALKQSATAGESKDGMDITLCQFDPQSKKIKYAAANNSLFVLRNGTLTEYNPDKQPVGFYHEIKSFSQHEIQLQTGDRIYTFTDGYADQFGGSKGKKFKYKQLQELLIANSSAPMSVQKEQLEKKFQEWRGNLEQVDDILLIGIRI